MLTRSFRALKLAPLITIVLLAAAGCSDESEPNMLPLGPGPGAAGFGAEPPIDMKNGTPTIRQIMGRLTKGPNSLRPVIGKELEAEAPDWNTIQPQTDEFARLASALGKNTPRKGSTESWAKLSTAFSESADALDKASKAKNRDAALKAHSQITGSCMGCHRQHRGMEPGMGKMGGPPPGSPGTDAPKRPGPG